MRSLGLDVRGEQVQILEKLLAVEGLPSDIKSWAEMRIPIGLPHNQVWDVVAAHLEQLPAAVERVTSDHQHIDARITE